MRSNNGYTEDLNDVRQYTCDQFDSHMDVSVVIPVYNAEAFINDAVRSALACEQVREVVLVEDGSPDNSLPHCHKLVGSDTRVRLFRHEGGRNKGAAASRNVGIRNATCTYVAFLDADDRFLPERFAAEVPIFRDHPDADGVYSAIGVYYHDEEGQRRFDRLFRNKLTTVRVHLPPDQLFPAMIGLSGILDVGHFSLDGLTMKRSALLSMPQLMREDIGIGEDSEFIHRLAFHTRLYPGVLDAPVSLRGVHADNRITKDPDRNASKLIMFNSLLEWSQRTPVGDAVRIKLHKDVVYYRILCAASAQDRVKGIGLVLRHPGLLKRIPISEAFVSMLFGRGTWLTRTFTPFVRRLHALLWKVKGGAPPVSVH